MTNAEIVSSTVCPHCGARRGRPCTFLSSNGRIVRGPHMARRQAAKSREARATRPLLTPGSADAKRAERLIRHVLEGECSARCMDDGDDRELTIEALMHALTRRT